MINFAMTDLGARRLGAASVASALLAPAAMLFGAIGLFGLWTLAARTTPPGPPADAPVAATSPHPTPFASLTTPAARDPVALDRLLADLGAPVPLARPAPVMLTRTAAGAVADLRRAEADMVSAADLQAQAQLKRDQAAFRATGLNARAYMAMAPAADLASLEARDARVLARRLDVDTPLARQVARTAQDLIAARTLDQAAAALPLATPVDDPVRSSGFGMRIDPFTRQITFHPGQDFAGHYGEPIHVTAPGVISFVGQRSGYGNCVEVDHGFGLKTRYGHLSGFTQGVGSPVKTGDVIGRMGSTGRSTGVHLHYEVWASGRLLNPAPFLSAGAAMLRG